SQLWSPARSACRLPDSRSSAFACLGARPRNAEKNPPLGRLPGGMVPSSPRAAIGFPSTPDFARHPHDQRQLCDLGIDGDVVAQNRAGKAALRAERQLFERDVPARLVNAPFETVGPFHAAA